MTPTPMKSRSRIIATLPLPVRKAKRQMNFLAQGPGVFSVEPWTFQCRRCRLVWNADLPMNIDIHQVTCSNCYSEDVIVVAVRITAFEEKGE